ncbi:MAG: hypothetical protein ACRD2L_21265 [Terriglobia bacterium]
MPNSILALWLGFLGGAGTGDSNGPMLGTDIPSSVTVLDEGPDSEDPGFVGLSEASQRRAAQLAADRMTTRAIL